MLATYGANGITAKEEIQAMGASVTLLQQESFAETYHDVEKLIYSTVHTFISRYGGEFEELNGEANLAFVRAYHNHNEGSSSFSYWVRFIVWKTLLERQRESLRKRTAAEVLSLQGQDDLDVPEPRSKFCLMEFIDELGEDAKLVAWLALDTPIGVTSIMTKRGGHGRQRRSVLRDYLIGLGWTAARVAESFEEIATILKQFP